MIRAGLAGVAVVFIVIGSIFYGLAGVISQTSSDWPS